MIPCIESGWPGGRCEGGVCYNLKFRYLLGRRSTVGHRALDAVIGVRIPTSQPAHPQGTPFLLYERNYEAIPYGLLWGEVDVRLTPFGEGPLGELGHAVVY